MRSPGPAVRFQGKAKRNPVEHPGEYHDAMITVLELIWGKGFMTPGGEGNVANMIDGLDVRGKRILEIGSGLGGPAFVLAGKYGALVVGTDLEPHLVEHAQHRARELELDAQTEFLLVNRGSLEFADESVAAQEFPLEALVENEAFLSALKEPSLQTIHTQETSLESIFIRVTGEELA